MKALLVSAATSLVAFVALAQGQFNFGNRVTVAGIDARMFYWDCITPLSGAAFLAQAYAGMEWDSLTPVGSPVPFRTGAAAGYISSHIVTTPYPGGTPVWVDMRVWEAAGGATYEAAVASGRFYGRSNPIQLLVAEAPLVPPDMVGLQSFCVIPEPSPLALGLLGAAVLLLRCRG